MFCDESKTNRTVEREFVVEWKNVSVITKLFSWNIQEIASADTPKALNMDNPLQALP